MSEMFDERAEVVELRVPARPGFVSAIRLTAASLGAMCELTVDDIEDVRLLVDEACSVLLPLARPDADLQIQFAVQAGCLQVETFVVSDDGADLDRTGFAWTVLQALATSVDTSSADGRVSVRLTKRRAVTRQ